jgi:hypothetical protein
MSRVFRRTICRGELSAAKIPAAQGGECAPRGAENEGNYMNVIQMLDPTGPGA